MLELNPLNHPICFTIPKRLTPFSAWLEHIPFAMFFVELLRPKMIVELGTQYGDSYCAFCQAVTELKLDTYCYAIDTWQGDSQASFYGPEVLADLRKHHDPLYGSFSRLIQSTFDEALQHFEDGTIDILHIDGYHTYESVKHDFESWLPKMSACGAVLFHDINVREGDFGIRKFWDETKARYPHFEFLHCHGLGVLAVGEVSSKELQALLQVKGKDATTIRNFFFQIGYQLTMKVADEAKDGELENQKRKLVEKSSQISELGNAMQAKDSQISELGNALQAKDFQAKGLEIQMQQMQRGIVMQILNRYQKVVEKLLPSGTRRRYYYELGLTGIRVIINEGWRSFWLQAKRKLGQKKGSRRTDPYQRWIAQNEPSKEELYRYRQESLSFQYRPKISIITPVRNTDEKYLRLAIDSVLNQVYDNYELCLATDASTKPYISETLTAYEQKDSRIKVQFLPENKEIAGDSNEALSLATGEFIALLDHDDELAPFALYEVVKLLNEKPELDFIYSDEDKITNEGKRASPFLKPDWSPDMLLSCMYTGHFSVYRKAILDDIGGFRVDYDDALDYDLVLRFIEKTLNVYHIPKILCHNRAKQASSGLTTEVSSQAHNAGKKVLEDYLVRNGIEGEVQSGKWKGCYRIKRKILESPLVSIIIPSRDKLNFLKPCIESILKKTDYSIYEIVIVDNQSQEARTLRYYDKIKKNPKVRILEYDKPFNFSAINNYAVSQANGDYVLFLNNDTEVISEEWLSAMLEHAQRKEVGAVGCLLLYPNNNIQHAGIISGSGSPGRHSHRYLPVSSQGYYLRPHLVQNLSAVTGACMLLRKEVFQEVGGFDKNLPIAWNDIDICLKIRQKGYLIVYTPYAKLYHPECTTRGYDDTIEKQARVMKEEAYMKLKWGHVLDSVDPYYHPGLTQTGEDFALKMWLEETIKLGKPLPRLDSSNVAGYTGWFNESGYGDTGNPIITKLWYEVYCSRPDLQATFPDIFGAHREAFLKWVSIHGRNEYPVLKQTSVKESTRSPVTIDSAAELGVNIAGYITGEFGVAAASRALIRAIQKAGIPHILNNIASPAHSSQDSTFQGFSKISQYPINIIHVNANESLDFLIKEGLTYFAGKYNIGYWAWELSRFPEEWLDSFKYYDEIWVLSAFSLDSILRASPIPVFKIPPSIYLDETRINSDRRCFGLRDDSYIFLFNFDFHSHFQRKNPLALVKAFKMAFGNSKDAVLVLKYINHTYYPSETKALNKAISGAPNIKIIDTHLRKDDLYSLVASCDCYVSLHRSEGFGLTMAEAMYLKKPVIATGYSGNMDFMNANNSFPVKYKIVDVGKKDYPPFKKGYVWAEPDISHTAELMRFVHENREYAAQIGRQAAEDIKNFLSPAVVGQQIRERLELLLYGK